jgi:hypothetical protein
VLGSPFPDLFPGSFLGRRIMVLAGTGGAVFVQRPLGA